MKRMTTEENLLGLLLHGTAQNLQDAIDIIHPADTPDLLCKHKEYVQDVLNRLPDDIPADIVEEEDDEDKYELLKRFSDSKQRHILNEMSSDETTDLIGKLEGDEQADTLKKVDSEDQEDVCKLVSSDVGGVGGAMITEFIRICAKNIVKGTPRFLQKNIDEETTYHLYVVDREDVLRGIVSLHGVVTSSFDIPIMDIVNPNVRTVLYSDDREEVTHHFERYGFILMPVVNEQQHMLGVTEFDDITDAIQKESIGDIHRLGGANKEERVDSSIREPFSSRTPWLIVNFFTAILAAAVVNMFEATIVQAIALATAIPIVTGMGSNAGARTLTTVVHGLPLGEPTKEDAVMILLKEISVGILSGIVIGVVVAFGAMLMESNPIFGPVTETATFLNMILANLTGYFIPIVLEKLHVDPALASGMLATTVTSVMRFLMPLGLTTSMPPYMIQ